MSKSHRNGAISPPTHEDLGYAKRDASLYELGSAHHHEEAFAVTLDLETLVGVPYVLDGEAVKAELRLHPFQELH